MKTKNRLLFSSLITVVLTTGAAMISQSAHAAPLTWDSDSDSGNGITDGSGTWNDTNTNWYNGTSNAAWVPGSTAMIGSSTTSTTGGTITVTGTQSLDGLTLGTGAANYTLSVGTLDFGSGNANVNIVNDGLLTLNSALAGSGTLNFTTAKNTWQRGVTLGADNSAFTGKMSFANVGANYFWVTVVNDNNFGAVPAVYTADALTLNGVTFWNKGATLSIAANRGITLIGNNSIYNYTNQTLNLNSVITGAGAPYFDAGTGVINLNAVNTYAGNTTLFGGKTVIGTDNALPHGAGKGNVDFRAYGTGGKANLDLNGRVVTMNGLSSSYNTAGTGIDNSAAGTATLILGDYNANGNTFAGVIINTGGALSVTKIGTGTQTLSGNLSYTGATTVNAGTLVFSGNMTGASPLIANSGGTLQADLSTNTTGVFNTASTVTLGGGTLNIKGKSTGTSSQTLGNLTLTANTGASKISITPNGGAGTTLTLGNTWTYNAGSTLLVDLSAAGTSALTSNPGVTNGIIGGYAFAKDATGTGFATVSGGNVVRYTGATTLNATVAASNLDPTTNYVVPTGVSLSGPSASQTVNSLEVGNGGLGINSGKTLTIASGGLLFNNPGGANWASISGNKLTSGTSDLTVYSVTGNGYQIYAQITGNIGLVKDGPGGLIISGANDYTGNTVILAGGVTGLVPFGAGKGNLLVNSGASFDLAAGSKSINGLSQSTGAVGGTVTNTWGGPQTLTLGNGDATASYNGVISGTGGNALSLTKVGTGTQTLSGANTYSGATTVSAGTLTLGKANTGNDASTVTIASTGATLNLTYTGTDMVDKLFVGATQKAPGVYGKIGSTLPVIGIAQITGDGTLTVASGPVGSDYAAWANDPSKGNIPGEPADGDFDNDGIANIMEYALGMDPRTSSQPAGVLSGNVITYTKGTDAIANGDVSWVIETSQTLATGSWTPVVTQPAGDTTPTISYTFTPGSPAENFARLKVTTP